MNFWSWKPASIMFPIMISFLVLSTPMKGFCGPVISPVGDIRMRVDSMNGVYHFSSESDRQWVRFRTRGGFRVDVNDHRFEIRVANDHRHYLEPDKDLNWDEIVIDHFFVKVKADTNTFVTIGRQDIVWPSGFLVLDGHHLDGSRSFFHDGVRLTTPTPIGSLDAALVYNKRQPGLVLLNDQDRNLTFGDETAFLARLTGQRWSGSIIVKDETGPSKGEPRFRTWTLGGRYVGSVGNSGHAEAELAIQYQDGTVASPVPRKDGQTDLGNGWAMAGYGGIEIATSSNLATEIGGFFYSGPGTNLRPFHAPWGNWSKWSNLYIYTLIGESTPGRLHVSVWENIAAPRASISWAAHEKVDMKLCLNWLLAPAPELLSRGLLAQIYVDVDLPWKTTARAQYERLEPGAFHDGRYGLPAIDGAVDFLRWQLYWRF